MLFQNYSICNGKFRNYDTMARSLCLSIEMRRCLSAIKPDSWESFERSVNLATAHNLSLPGPWRLLNGAPSLPLLTSSGTLGTRAPNAVEKVGKLVADHLYVHLSAVHLLPAQAHRDVVESALQAITPLDGAGPNVAKLNLRTGALSLLSYADFEDAPFPELRASWVFASGPTQGHQLRLYSDSLNPPILHRKELLVAPDHPSRPAWAELTLTAEGLGLFDEPSTIGFRMNWERLVARSGYQVIDRSFVPVGNDLGAGDDTSVKLNGAVERHLTALVRSGLSAPVQMLLKHGLLNNKTSFFDYGCGRNGDVERLLAIGYVAHGWDPHFAPLEELRTSDVVNLGFVVNVIEDSAERVEALRRAYSLTRGVLSVSVMLATATAPGQPFNDGVITSRRTFQKYYTQSEIRQFVEDVTQATAFMVAPGVAFVFSDKNMEQRFASGRFRTKHVAERQIRLSIRALSPPRAPRPARQLTLTKAERQMSALRPQLERLWETALDLGRWPEPAEFDDANHLLRELGTWSRALRLLQTHFDRERLAAAAIVRRDDLLLFSVAHLVERRSYRQLEPRLQRDIRCFFGDFQKSLDAARQLLRDASNSGEVLEACRTAARAGLGWMDGEHSLQVHIALVERLPAVLRGYIACGLLLWDSTTEVQCVKVHVASGKLTLLEFEDFDTAPIPRLRRRIKINIRRLNYDVFEYGAGAFPKPPLLWKSRFMHEDLPGYAEQLAFDEALAASGADLWHETELTTDDISIRLRRCRREIDGFTLVASRDIPDPDERCGRHFTFRALIECGETQAQSRLPNLPSAPETYNALFALATNILDPIIEYFGAIRLTYGFCSPMLGKLITRRVAPSLDQHASHEVNRRGRRICGRDGAACDFLVEDEDMEGVASWIAQNLPFDRMYVYGKSKPIHVSFGPDNSRASFNMRETRSGALVPSRSNTYGALMAIAEAKSSPEETD